MKRTLSTLSTLSAAVSPFLGRKNTLEKLIVNGSVLLFATTRWKYTKYSKTLQFAINFINFAQLNISPRCISLKSDRHYRYSVSEHEAA